MRVDNHAGPDRIEMNVAHQFKQIAVGIDQQGLVSALKEVPGLLPLSVAELGIAEAKILHDSGKWHIIDLDNEVQVVAHQAKGMDPMAKPFGPLLQEEVEATAVRLVEKDFLARIASEYDMIDSAGKMNTRFSRHGVTLL
ncbi:hypothetical protein DESUT3_30810 [Desulfuromonas versatilis]|uniref:Uncharacterized protein n=1 Tax=Desulfuromonas versatilis TaxID=2802975 RepID=A0ABN6E101_9BACT|nr:hypothetical protein DESUT3_30810 [Desulfuromonas versatilis]